MSVTSYGYSTPNSSKLIDRLTLLQMLLAALEAQTYRFARQVALGWLAAYPGDLEVSLLLARVFLAEGKQAQAVAILEKLVRVDPENEQAQSLLAQVAGEGEAKAEAKACSHILTAAKSGSPGAPTWADQLKESRELLAAGKLDEAEALIFKVLAQKPDFSLAGVVHLRIIRARKDRLVELKFAEIYHERWPEALPFILSLAEIQLETGDEAKAVNLLHQCVANDAAGEVAVRWWGKGHSYTPLWPERLETTMDVPVPAEVATRLGWNQLAERSVRPEKPAEPIILNDPKLGEKSDSKPPVEIPLAAMSAQVGDSQSQVEPGERENGKLLRRARPKSEIVRQVEKEFDRLAKKMKSPAFAKADGRYPIYVVFSTRSGLIKQFGEQTAAVLDEEMRNLAEAVGKKPGWSGMVFYPDDAEITAKFGLKPTESNDPWKLKLSLVDLDHALSKKGARIGALLIVGGPEIVPFHRLPNPTDDSDDDVPSDNPYATLDSNYFVPEWPVGRMPGEAGPDAGLLLQQIRQAIQEHSSRAKSLSGWTPLTGFISVWGSLFRTFTRTRSPRSLGYTASVWKTPSIEVFKPIGEPRSMVASPPEFSGSFDRNRLNMSTFGYFNLHGLPDTNEWYGQRDLDEADLGPDYPVALTTKDLVKNGRTPKVVFTEACYGGFIVSKTERDSIAIRFLSIGVPCFVGSTCTAYGSIGTPLIAADLLGNYFWRFLREGYNTGEALLQAKIALASEMTRRQGYLDGEDQKTLISFVLYGDPLYQNDSFRVQPKQYVRQQAYLRVKTADDQWEEHSEAADMPAETLSQVKRALAPYLPGVDRAEIFIRARSIAGESAKATGLRKLARKVAPKSYRQTVVTVKKPIQLAAKTYYQFARVTLDGRGKIAKMVVSR